MNYLFMDLIRGEKIKRLLSAISIVTLAIKIVNYKMLRTIVPGLINDRNR